MIHRRLGPLLAVLPALLASSSVLAAADLAVTLSAPAGIRVYETGRYEVRVENHGNRTAQGVSVRLDLPATHTSPSVHIMGTLAAASPGCSLSGARLTCAMGQLRKGKSATVWVDISLPVQTPAATFRAQAWTTSSEPNQADNVATRSVSLIYYDTPIAGPLPVTNEHCTGTDLTGWFECTLYPSSITSHDTILEDGGAITFVGAPASYTGAWSQATPDSLQMAYYDGGTLVALFQGFGVGDGCFEGLTLFPGSTYNSPYTVCPR